jgi:hypothetical protein
MARNQLGHLKHADLFLAVKHSLQVLIDPLVLRGDFPFMDSFDLVGSRWLRSDAWLRVEI